MNRTIIPIIQSRATGDFNDLLKTGWYYTQDGMTANKPTDWTYGYILVLAFDQGAYVQLFIGSGLDEFYKRSYSGNPRAWGVWKKITVS